MTHGTAAPRPGERDEAHEEESRGSDQSSKVGDAGERINGSLADEDRRPDHAPVPQARPCPGARVYLGFLKERWLAPRKGAPNGRDCWESQATLAGHLDVEERTIRSWEAALKEARLIVVERRAGGHGRIIRAPSDRHSADGGSGPDGETHRQPAVTPPAAGCQSTVSGLPPTCRTEKTDTSPCPAAGLGLGERGDEPAPSGVPPALWARSRLLRDAGIALDHDGAWIEVGGFLQGAARQGVLEETVDALLWRFRRGDLQAGGIVGVARQGNRARRYGALAVLDDEPYALWRREQDERELAALPPEVLADALAAVPPAPPRETPEERLARKLRARDEQIAELMAMEAASAGRVA